MQIKGFNCHGCGAYVHYLTESSFYKTKRCWKCYAVDVLNMGAEHSLPYLLKKRYLKIKAELEAKRWARWEQFQEKQLRKDLYELFGFWDAKDSRSPKTPGRTAMIDKCSECGTEILIAEMRKGKGLCSSCRRDRENLRQRFLKSIPEVLMSCSSNPYRLRPVLEEVVHEYKMLGFPDPDEFLKSRNL